MSKIFLVTMSLSWLVAASLPHAARGGANIQASTAGQIVWACEVDSCHNKSGSSLLFSGIELVFQAHLGQT